MMAGLDMSDDDNIGNPEELLLPNHLAAFSVA